MLRSDHAVPLSYRRIAQRHPPLTREEEYALGSASHAGDLRARTKLFNHNVAFALMLSVRWSQGSGVALDDLVQEAMIGLMKAAEHFQPEKGSRFSSYASWWIRAYLGRYVREFRTTIRQPIVKPGEERAPISIRHSLDHPVGDENGDTFLDFLADADADPAWEVIRTDLAVRVRARLSKRFAKMRGMEQDIILFRLMSDRKNLEDIGDEWGLSRERIRQLQKQLLPKLRRLLTEFEDT